MTKNKVHNEKGDTKLPSILNKNTGRQSDRSEWVKLKFPPLTPGFPGIEGRKIPLEIDTNRNLTPRK